MPSADPSHILDFHVHVFPDDLAARAIPQMEARAGVRAYYDGTVRGLLASMQSAGVGQSLLQPVATKPEQVEGINRWCREVVENHAGRLFSFGALHPDMSPEALRQEITFLTANGFRGVKLHPDYQHFHPHEDRLANFYQALEQAGLMVLFHSGIDLGLYPPLMGEPEQILQVHKGFPRLTLIAAHMGGFRLWDDVEKYLVGTPVYLDSAYCAGDCPSERFRELVRSHGASRVLFASDGPWGDQGEHLRFVRESGLSPEAIAAISGGNARRLLRLE